MKTKKINIFMAIILVITVFASMSVSVFAEEYQGDKIGCDNPNCLRDHVFTDENGNAEISFNIFENQDGTLSVLRSSGTSNSSDERILPPVGKFSLLLTGWTALSNSGDLNWEHTSSSDQLRSLSTDVYVKSTSELMPFDYLNRHIVEMFSDFGIYKTGYIGSMNFMPSETSVKVGFSNFFASYILYEGSSPGGYIIVHRK